MPQRQATANACHRGAVLGCVLVAVLLLISGCRLNTDELDFTRNEPAKADIIGKWIRVSDSSEDGNQSSATKQELNLLGDSSFWVAELPTSPGVPGASPKGLLSGAGVWHLDKGNSAFTMWIINLDFANHHRETVHLMHQKPPYLIHIYMGDPDEGGAILFKRVP